jgi:DNA-binding NarL/FixJ family response regulator
MSPNKINVAITDDHQMVIEGLLFMLKDYADMDISDTYNNGNALLAGLQRRQPDVLLLDIHLNDFVGEDLVPVIIKKYPGIRILAITSIDNVSRVRNLIRMGCLGYLLKNVPASILVEGIRTVYTGVSYIGSGLKEMLLQDMLQLKSELPSRELLLTRREKEILQLLSQQCTSKEIAERLFISLNTVENHRKHLFQKMDVRNVAGLIKKTFALGLIE